MEKDLEIDIDHVMEVLIYALKLVLNHKNARRIYVIRRIKNQSLIFLSGLIGQSVQMVVIHIEPEGENV